MNNKERRAECSRHSMWGWLMEAGLLRVLRLRLFPLCKPPPTQKHMVSHINKQTLVGNDTSSPPITPAFPPCLLQPCWQQNTQRAASCCSCSPRSSAAKERVYSTRALRLSFFCGRVAYLLKRCCNGVGAFTALSDATIMFYKNMAECAGIPGQAHSGQTLALYGTSSSSLLRVSSSSSSRMPTHECLPV